MTKLFDPLELEEAPEIVELVTLPVGSTAWTMKLVVMVVLATYPVSIVKTGLGRTLDVYWNEFVKLRLLEVEVELAGGSGGGGGGVKEEVGEILGVTSTVTIWVEVEVL